MQNRLVELRQELEKGRQRLASLDSERQELRDVMLRISGAIQVLEELQSQEAAANLQPQLAEAS